MYNYCFNIHGIDFLFFLSPFPFYLTIKNIGLDLGTGIAKFVESLTSIVDEDTILYRCNNSDENIILHQNYH